MSSVGSNIPAKIPPPTILIQRFTIRPPASAVSVLSLNGGGNLSEAGRAICDIDTSKYANRIVHACEMLQRGGIVAKPMSPIHKNSGRRLRNSGRRIVVVAVPPVDELDLVGPLQVFNSVNRLARSEEHTSELQSLRHLVCRLLLHVHPRDPTSLPTRRSSDLCSCLRDASTWRHSS